MSSVAQVFVIDQKDFNSIAQASKIHVKRKLFKKVITDKYYEVLEGCSSYKECFKGSGYIFGTILVYLENNGIDVFAEEFQAISNEVSENRGNSTIIFQKNESISQFLEEMNRNIEPLQLFCKEFSSNPVEHELLPEAISFLKRNIDKLDSKNQFLLLEID